MDAESEALGGKLCRPDRVVTVLNLVPSFPIRPPGQFVRFFVFGPHAANRSPESRSILTRLKFPAAPQPHSSPRHYQRPGVHVGGNRLPQGVRVGTNAPPSFARIALHVTATRAPDSPGQLVWGQMDEALARGAKAPVRGLRAGQREFSLGTGRMTLRVPIWLRRARRAGSCNRSLSLHSKPE